MEDESFSTTGLTGRQKIVISIPVPHSSFQLQVLAHPLHDAQVVSQVVDGVQRGRQSFAGVHQVA
jgi:hypothetical protein